MLTNGPTQLGDDEEKCEISDSHGGRYEEAVFWVVVPCSVSNISTHRPDDGGSK
jgi:hypothetical protein